MDEADARTRAARGAARRETRRCARGRSTATGAARIATRLAVAIARDEVDFERDGYSEESAATSIRSHVPKIAPVGGHCAIVTCGATSLLAAILTMAHASLAMSAALTRLAPVRARRGPASASPRRVGARRVAARAAPETGSSSEDTQAGAGLKAVWYGAEAVGKVVGATKTKDDADASPSANAGSTATVDSTGATLTRARALELLREDYDSSYFVSGVGALAAYDPACEFSDPFVAFEGVDRFKQNVGNLGGMMRDIDLKITGWEENEDDLVTSWRFSCVLDLPWRPKLAAAGGTTHAFDEGTGKVVKHIERWDVDPGKVVKQLLVPASKLPENRWEVFMFSLADGDAFGCWLAASPGVAKLTAPWVAVSLAAKAAGISAEGTPLGAVDTLAFWLLVLALVAEPVRFFKGVIGS